ncbi:MAG: hypothetical protein IJX26_03490 [Clostridia bacterium]|nr:hypothetical protein [Clostridia bacterium]
MKVYVFTRIKEIENITASKKNIAANIFDAENELNINNHKKTENCLHFFKSINGLEKYIQTKKEKADFSVNNYCIGIFDIPLTTLLVETEKNCGNHTKSTHLSLHSEEYIIDVTKVKPEWLKAVAVPEKKLTLDEIYVK